MYLLSFVMGIMTDVIIKKKWLSVSNTRKFFNTIGEYYFENNDVKKIIKDLLLEIILHTSVNFVTVSVGY